MTRKREVEKRISIRVTPVRQKLPKRMKNLIQMLMEAASYVGSMANEAVDMSLCSFTSYLGQKTADHALSFF